MDNKAKYGFPGKTVNTRLELREATGDAEQKHQVDRIRAIQRTETFIISEKFIPQVVYVAPESLVLEV